MKLHSPKSLIWLTVFTVMATYNTQLTSASGDASSRQANAACGQYQRFANAHRNSGLNAGLCHSAIYLIQHIAETASNESSATTRFHNANVAQLQQSDAGQANANADLQDTLNNSRSLMRTFELRYRDRIRSSDIVLNAREQNLERIRNTQTRDANSRSRAEDQLARAYSALEQARNYAHQRLSTYNAGIFETIVDGSEASQLQNALNGLGISTNQYSRTLHDNGGSAFDHLAESIERSHSAPSHPTVTSRDADVTPSQPQRSAPSASAESPQASARGGREPGAEPPAVAANREVAPSGGVSGESGAPVNASPAGGLRSASSPENETAPAHSAQQTVVTREEVVFRSENLAEPRQARERQPQILAYSQPAATLPSELEVTRETQNIPQETAGVARSTAIQDHRSDDAADISGMSLDAIDGGAEERAGFDDPMTLALAQSFEKRLSDEAAARMAQVTSPTDTAEINYSGASRAGASSVGSATTPITSEEDNNKKNSNPEDEERAPASKDPTLESESALASDLLRGEDAPKALADLEAMNSKTDGEDALLDSLGIPRRNDFNNSMGVIAPLTVAQATANDPIAAVSGPAMPPMPKSMPLPKVEPRDAARAQALIDELSATVREDKPASPRAGPLKLAANPNSRK